jgi:hypothetical protein
MSEDLITIKTTVTIVIIVFRAGFKFLELSKAILSMMAGSLQQRELEAIPSNTQTHVELFVMLENTLRRGPARRGSGRIRMKTNPGRLPLY